MIGGITNKKWKKKSFFRCPSSDFLFLVKLNFDTHTSSSNSHQQAWSKKKAHLLPISILEAKQQNKPPFACHYSKPTTNMPWPPLNTLVSCYLASKSHGNPPFHKPSNYHQENSPLCHGHPNPMSSTCCWSNLPLISATMNNQVSKVHESHIIQTTTKRIPLCAMVTQTQCPQHVADQTCPWSLPL